MKLPADYESFLNLSPEQRQHLCDDLVERPLESGTIDRWLQDWAALAALFQESLARFDVATSVNTADDAAKQRLDHYRETVWPVGVWMSQRLNERLKAHADLLPTELREATGRNEAAEKLNQTRELLDLLNYESRLVHQYEKTLGAQQVEWEARPIPIRQLRAVLRGPHGDQRKLAWRVMQERREQDHDRISRLWSELLDTRLRLAEINGFDDYLSYRWTQLGRTDYTPEDSRNLHSAMRRHWAPLFAELVNAYQAQHHLDTVQPWDVEVLPGYREMQPFVDADGLLSKTINGFRRLDADFAFYVENLNDMGFIDLADRAHTSLVGGFSRAIGRHGNFIFLNLQGTYHDMVNLVHEIGHAVALHASCQQPYLAFWGFPSDFSETPSSAMEMLSMPYWDEFCEPAELDHARRLYFYDVLRSSLMDTIIDVLQHWMYRHPETARDLNACSLKAYEYLQQYLPGINWAADDVVDAFYFLPPAMYMPLHAMEYVFGRLAGLKLLRMPEQERLARYKDAIAMGSKVTARTLFGALDLHFPITERDVKDAASDLALHL